MSKAVTTSTTGLPPPAALSTNRLRRALLTGSAAAVAAMATGAVASAGAAPASPDAELIGLCADFDALFEGVSALAFEAADAAACVIEVDQRRLLDRICALTPATDEGCRAVARL